MSMAMNVPKNNASAAKSFLKITNLTIDDEALYKCEVTYLAVNRECNNVQHITLNVTGNKYMYDSSSSSSSSPLLRPSALFFFFFLFHTYDERAEPSEIHTAPPPIHPLALYRPFSSSVHKRKKKD